MWAKFNNDLVLMGCRIERKAPKRNKVKRSVVKGLQRKPELKFLIELLLTAHKDQHLIFDEVLLQ